MKVILILLGLFAFQANAYTKVSEGDIELFRQLSNNGITPFIMEDKVRQTLENLFQSLRDKGLDPLIVDQSPVNLTNPLIELLGSVDSVAVLNLVNITISQLQLKVIPLTLTIGLDWAPITASLNYDIDGKILQLIPLFGKGHADGEIDGLSIYVSASMTSINNNVVIRTLDLDFNIANLNVSATGLVGGELGELICQVLNENAVPMIGQIKEAYLPAIKEVITQAVDKFLEGKSIQDIIDMITGGGKTTAAPHRP